tara:strand:+ start:1642 stop:2265 length:624 start_codon:yes stop_codon:yes gene_type:complete
MCSTTQTCDNDFTSIPNTKVDTVWFAYSKTNTSHNTSLSEINTKVVNKTFYFQEYGSLFDTNNGGTVKIGQFLSSMWFNEEIDINSTYNFYVCSTEKHTTHKKVVNEINSFLNKRENSEDINIEQTIFTTFHTFTLQSEKMIETFNTLDFNNTGERIELQSINDIHRLSIYLSINHQIHNKDNNMLDNIDETVLIDTPSIMYYKYNN